MHVRASRALRSFPVPAMGFSWYSWVFVFSTAPCRVGCSVGWVGWEDAHARGGLGCGGSRARMCQPVPPPPWLKTPLVNQRGGVGLTLLWFRREGGQTVGTCTNCKMSHAKAPLWDARCIKIARRPMRNPHIGHKNGGCPMPSPHF